MQRRTKVVATIGPASDSPEVLKALMVAGMDVARLGLAHETLEIALARFDAIRQIAADLGREVGILADLPGPKVRAGHVEGNGIVLPAGNAGEVTGWMEDVEAGTAVETRLALDDGRGLWFASQAAHYLAGQVDEGLLRRVLADVATTAGLSPRDLGPDVRLERRGNFNFLFNYGPEPVTIAHDLLIGQNPVPPAGVAIWRD